MAAVLCVGRTKFRPVAPPWRMRLMAPTHSSEHRCNLPKQAPVLQETTACQTAISSRTFSMKR